MSQEITEDEMPAFPDANVFLIKLEARAAYRFRLELPLVLHTVAPDNRRFDVRLETEYDGETKLPRAIVLTTMKTTAESLSEALVWGMNFVQGYLNCLAVATNAYIEDAQLIYAADVSRVSARREFWQAQSQIVRRSTPSETRLIDYEAASTFALAVLDSQSKNRDRLMRAVQQYVLALSRWTPATKVLAVGHAFMGVEALTPVAKRSLKFSDDELYEQEKADGLVSFDKGDWYKSKAADQRARRMVTFDGDAVTLKGASCLSNGLEHGFGDYAKLIELAETHGDKTLDHLRHAIIKLSDLDPGRQAALLSARFAVPMPLFSLFAVFGTLLEPILPEDAAISPLDLSRIVAGNAGYDALSGAYQVTVNTAPAALRPVAIEGLRLRP